MSDKSIFKQIYQLAQPYLNTRHNDIHTEMSMQLAYQLLSAEGGQESIVIPAIILHDVGWQKVPVDKPDSRARRRKDCRTYSDKSEL